MTLLEKLLVLAGICHFGILIASALVPRVLDWRRELRQLAPLSRHLIWTHGVFIVLIIIAFGTITLANASALAAGSTLGRWVCGVITCFWLARLIIQCFVFDARPFLKSTLLKLGYHGLTAVFTFLVFVYSWAMLRA
jgi:hypothetical protein